MQPYQIEPNAGDTCFDDSPDTCDPACLCSRCRNIIHSGQNIVRALTLDQKECRYHARCLGFKTPEDPCECMPSLDENDVWTYEDESRFNEKLILEKEIQAEED